MPVVSDCKLFDRTSGGWLERMVFNYRVLMLVVCAALTMVLGYQLKNININASFERMIPQSHAYIQNYIDNKSELRGLGNTIRVVVERVDGDIFEPKYLDALQRINDELILIPGVDRAWVKSIWTPSVRWMEVTEEGFTGGPVLPPTYDGTPQQVELLRQNINRAGIVGSLVGTDLKSAMIVVPLLDVDPASGKKLDYRALSKALEERIRSQETPDIKVHVIGFAKLVGDLIDGLIQVFFYFAVAAIVAALIIYAYTRCLRSTALVITCSIIAAIWQLGLATAIGFDLDPYSMLVPFLVFAIGVSHGVQKMNGIMQDIGRGTHKFVAARYTFRRLFLAGATALVADAVGFAVLMVIDIPVIKGLALSASIGVAVLIFTNLLLLPVLLSFTGVSATAARRSLAAEGHGTGAAIWNCLGRFTSRRWATFAILGACALMVAGFGVSLHLKIGDLDAGAPELRPDSRYNRDNAYITGHYSLSSDLFAVILKTPANGSYKYESLVEADRLAWELRRIPGVQMTTSLVDAVRQVTSGTFEGSPKWLTLSRNQDVLNYGSQVASVNSPELFNGDASVMPIIAFLTDHKAETLDRVLEVSERFIAEHSTTDRQFMLVAGSAGIEAATNIVVRDANRTMLLYVYVAVILLSYITFRSWRAVVVAVIPLIMTSILCEALMVMLGIGVKVATLPVIALGVGIGIDYALYLLSIQLARQRQGDSLANAYRHAVTFTGKVVGLVGVTLAVGVVTWVFSPIKFQADMGILLSFMFVWNMLGALVLVPALSHFLLSDRSFARHHALAESAPCR
ncbi:MMPL family transporter [Pseudomonas sp. BN102]|uniref:efflux RND transporter permease subunit n=1 Tax=Pseudomonas sp. BN102 TaxID=2567886 RepID=UPI0024572D04|nr:MMPL family transporter [Pseudomonas sp. BN102]MDH4607467.1 RND family transporter [Pseudomonas sp. BN102]